VTAVIILILFYVITYPSSKTMIFDAVADQPDIVQDFVARVRNPTLVMLEWTPPQRPGVIKYRVWLYHLCLYQNWRSCDIMILG